MIVTPWARRALIEPLWAAASHTPRLREWRELEDTQYLSLTDLRLRQQARLQRLVVSACRDTPFYEARFRDAGVSPLDIRTADDLARLPVLTKQDIRTRGKDILSRACARETLMEFRTGGSTGTPLIVFATEDVSERRNACARRSDRWTGWNVGEPVAAVWGNPKLPATLKERLRSELLEPVIYLDTMALAPLAVGHFAEEWRRAKPTLLFGHAHSLYLLACSLRDMGIDSVRPRAILSTSMMLLAHERAVLESVFGIKVTDRYGCEEVGLIACECERHSGMHINVDHLIVEFLRDDGTPAAPGELASVVVTDLLNHAMPLIRYKVEDLACSMASPCSCGRGLPMMDRVAGRVADFLVRQDGVRVAGISLIENSLTKFNGIEQMQIVQDALDAIELRVVPAGDFDDSVRNELLDYFASVFPGTRIALDTVAAIQREQNGKYRFAICRVPSTNQAQSAEAR